MGKPRMIILVRHGQSEGNKNKDIHQYIPDHRVKLTEEGRQQAQDAGRRLRSLLRPDDTLQFFTSPYRRTRETTEGILTGLTADDPEQGPSPFPRHAIKVYEEPRLREQDFGNFQPCSAEMERMWQERADYGHFFYRIPNGESAADAYDRVSGFNESLWRQFGEPDFPSVCVLVTHGLMTRVFLMKWYHWSVEYFEDLRNINHCEFITMKRDDEGRKYQLQNQLRTWSEMKRRNSELNNNNKHKAAPRPGSVGLNRSESFLPTRRWGGCSNGCDHEKHYSPRAQKKESQVNLTNGGRSSLATTQSSADIKEDHPMATAPAEESQAGFSSKSHSRTDLGNKSKVANPNGRTEDMNDQLDDSVSPTNTRDVDNNAAADDPSSEDSLSEELDKPLSLHLKSRANANGSRKHRSSTGDTSDDSDWFDTTVHQFPKRMSISARQDITRAMLGRIEEHGESAPLSSSPSKRALHGSGRIRPNRTDSIKSEKEWIEDSGMAEGKMADALGDVENALDELDFDEQQSVVGQVVNNLKEKDRKSMSEVY